MRVAPMHSQRCASVVMTAARQLLLPSPAAGSSLWLCTGAARGAGGSHNRRFAPHDRSVAPRDGKSMHAARWRELIQKLDDSSAMQSRSCADRKPARRMERSVVLGEALASKGLELRFDSNLCATYIKGQVSGLEPDEVADVMAGMRYLNEYSDEYRTQLEEIEKKVEAEMGRRVQTFRSASAKSYHRLCGAAYVAVYGHRCTNAVMVRRDLASKWELWPDEWPWMGEGGASQLSAAQAVEAFAAQITEGGKAGTGADGT